MSAGFLPLRDNRVGSRALDHFCHSARCHYRDNGDSRVLPQLHVFCRISGTGRNDLYLFFRRDLRDLVGERAHQHNVYAERLIRKLTGAHDLPAEVFGIRIHCGDYSESASV